MTAPDEEDFHERADVVVAGAGMGGLVAAVRATECGADVLVLEKGSRAGGSMYISNGVVYTYDDYETFRENVPGGNATLQELLVTGKDEGLEWLESIGVTTRETEADLAFGSGKQIDPRPFTRTMVDRVEKGGGEVRLETALDGVIDEDGAVVGVVARGEDGSTRVRTDAVILATGGFQGNEALLESYVTDHAENLWLRSNPWSTGDGMIAARDVGAKTTTGMSTFYGHNLPAPPAEIPPDKLLEAKQNYGPFAVAVDRQGRRYTDESTTDTEVVLAQDTAKRAEGRAYYVLDDDLYDETVRGTYVGTRVETARELGGRVLRAESLSDLAAGLSEWGVDGQRAVRTIREYNEAIESGQPLDPPRQRNRRTIDEPPFRVVEVQPGITFTMGGLDVTERMEVLRRSASSSTLHYYPADPAEVKTGTVPGLYAAGVDVGNVMHRYYSGGLIVGLVTGRIAGERAAERSG